MIRQLNEDMASVASIALPDLELHFDAIQFVGIGVRFDGADQALLHIVADWIGEIEMSGGEIEVHVAGICIARAELLQRSAAEDVLATRLYRAQARHLLRVGHGQQESSARPEAFRTKRASGSDETRAAHWRPWKRTLEIEERGGCAQ